MENNVYRVEFYNNTEDGEEKKAVATNPSNAGNEGATDSASKKTGLEKYFAPMAMVGYARSVANRLIQSRISTVSLRTGYEAKQAREQMLYDIGNKVTNIGLSIAMGAKVGGGWGAVAGAVIGIGNEAISYGVRVNESAIAREQENTAIFLNQIRIGTGQRRRGAE